MSPASRQIETRPERKARRRRQREAGQVRARAARAMGRLAQLGDGSAETSNGLSKMIAWLELRALKDPSPEVRHRARWGLAGMASARQKKVFETLLPTWQRTRHRVQRRRLWEVLAFLRGARGRWSFFQLWKARWTFIRLQLQAGCRWLVATPVRRRVTASPLALLASLYLVLGSLYYGSTPEGSTAVVLRTGLPGFEALPGFGVRVFDTGFEIDLLKDRGRAIAEERVWGLWGSYRNGAFDWYQGILPLLPPAQSALTSWRLGRRDAARAELRRAVEEGEPDSDRVSTYLDLLESDSADSVIARLAHEQRQDAPSRSAPFMQPVPPEPFPTPSRPPDVQALPELVQASTSASSSTRAEALHDLVRLALHHREIFPQVRPLLREALEDRNPWVRWEAIAGRLLLADRDPDAAGEVFDLYLKSLRQTEDPEWEHNAKLLAREYTDANVEAVRWWAGHSVQAAASSDDFFVGQQVSQGLSTLADLRPAWLPELVEILASATLGDSDGAAHLQQLLWHWRDLPVERLRPAVSRLILRIEDRDPTVRAGAAHALGYLATFHSSLATDALGPLLNALASSDPDVAFWAAESLGILGHWQQDLAPQVSGVLAECLRTEDTEIRRTCGKGLERIAEAHPLSAETLETLVQSLTDSAPDVRLAAAHALATAAWREPLDLPRAVPILEALARREPDPDRRRIHAAALGCLAPDDPERIELVFETIAAGLAQDEDRVASSLYWLGHLGEARATLAPEALRRLEEQAARTDRPLHLRHLAIFRIRDIGRRHPGQARRALERLRPSLLDADPSVRWNAVVNGVQPILDLHPSMAGVARTLLTEALRVHPWDRLPTPATAQSLIQASALLAEREPDSVLATLDDPSSPVRRAGEQALFLAALKNPSVEARIRRALSSRRTSALPHLRLSATRTWERLELLRLARSAIDRQQDLEIWEEGLKALPRLGIQAAVNRILEEMHEARTGERVRYQ